VLGGLRDGSVGSGITLVGSGLEMCGGGAVTVAVTSRSGVTSSKTTSTGRPVGRRKAVSPNEVSKGFGDGPFGCGRLNVTGGPRKAGS